MSDPVSDYNAAANAAILANATHNAQNAAFDAASAAAWAATNPAIKGIVNQNLAQQDAINEAAKYQAASSQPRNDNVAPSAAYTQLINQYAANRNMVTSSGGSVYQGPVNPTVNPYNPNSAAGIAFDVGRTTGAINPYLAQTALQEGYTGPILLPSATNHTVSGYAIPIQNITSPQQVDWGVHTSPIADLSSGMLSGSRMVAGVANGQTVDIYVPYGNYAQTRIGDAKLALNFNTGELGIYQLSPGHSVFNLVGGGSRAALQSGMFTVNAAETPFTMEQGAVGKYILPSGEGKSRLGAEAYGGYVMNLDNRTVQSTGAQLSTYSNENNLANLVNPQGVNMGKAAAPGSNIPWSISEKSPAIQMMNENGIIPGSVSVPGGRLVGGNIVAGFGTTTENISPVTPTQPSLWNIVGNGISSSLSMIPGGIGIALVFDQFRGRDTTTEFKNSLVDIFNPSSSEKNLVSPETYESHLTDYNQKLSVYNTNLGNYNSALNDYQIGGSNDLSKYNSLQTGQAELNTQQNALQIQQSSLESERANVGIAPNIFTKLGNVYEGANTMLAPYTTDQTGIGKYLSTTPSTGNDVLDFTKGTYVGASQHPIDIAVAFGGGELYAGAKATLGWGVAKAAMTESPIIGNIGRLASTPTANVLGGWLEKGIGIGIVGESIINVANQPTAALKGETAGRTAIQFVGFGAGMSSPKLTPIEGETPNLMTRGITRVNDFMTKAPENNYQGRGFRSGELEISPLQRYGVGMQKSTIVPNAYGEDVSPTATYRTIGVVSRSGSVGQIEQVSMIFGGMKTTPEGTSLFIGKPSVSANEFRFAPDAYGNTPTFKPQTALDTYLVKTLAPNEAAKIDIGLDIRGRTSSSGLALKEVTPAIQTVIEGHQIPNARPVAEAITTTMKQYDVKLYGSSVQKGVGAEIGMETLGSTPKDLDVMIPGGMGGKQMSRPFAEDVTLAINKAAGQKVAELDLTGGVESIKVNNQKLFDIHNVDAKPAELIAQGVNSKQLSAADDFLGLGIKTEKPTVSREGVETISYSEQMGRKLAGSIEYTPEIRTVSAKDIVSKSTNGIVNTESAFSVTGQLAPKFEGRVKDIGHFYMGELGNIRVQEQSTNPLTRMGAEKSRGQLEQWLDLWGESASTHIRAQAAGKSVPIEIDFGGIKPEIVTSRSAFVSPSTSLSIASKSAAVMASTPAGSYSASSPSGVISPISISAPSMPSNSIPSRILSQSMASSPASAFDVSAPSAFSMSPRSPSPSPSPLASPSPSGFSSPSPFLSSIATTAPIKSPPAPSPFSLPPSRSEPPSPPTPSRGTDYPKPTEPPSYPKVPVSFPWGGGGGGSGGGFKRHKRQVEVFSFDLAGVSDMRNPFAIPSAPKKTHKK